MKPQKTQVLRITQYNPLAQNLQVESTASAGKRVYKFGEFKDYILIVINRFISIESEDKKIGRHVVLDIRQTCKNMVKIVDSCLLEFIAAKYQPKEFFQFEILSNPACLSADLSRLTMLFCIARRNYGTRLCVQFCTRFEMLVETVCSQAQDKDFTFNDKFSEVSLSSGMQLPLNDYLKTKILIRFIISGKFRKVIVENSQEECTKLLKNMAAFLKVSQSMGDVFSLLIGEVEKMFCDDVTINDGMWCLTELCNEGLIDEKMANDLFPKIVQFFNLDEDQDHDDNCMLIFEAFLEKGWHHNQVEKFLPKVLKLDCKSGNTFAINLLAQLSSKEGLLNPDEKKEFKNRLINRISPNSEKLAITTLYALKNVGDIIDFEDLNRLIPKILPFMRIEQYPDVQDEVIYLVDLVLQRERRDLTQASFAHNLMTTLIAILNEDGKVGHKSYEYYFDLCCKMLRMKFNINDEQREDLRRFYLENRNNELRPFATKLVPFIFTVSEQKEIMTKEITDRLIPWVKGNELESFFDNIEQSLNKIVDKVGAVFDEIGQ